MRTALFSLFLSLLFSSAMAQNTSNAIEGTWVNGDQDAHIKIFKQGDKYFGKIVWATKTKTSDGKEILDKKNPNKSLRTRPILGLVIISDLEYKNGKWVNGKIYSPKRGTTASFKASLKNNDELLITVSKSLVTRSQTWKRL